MPASAHWPRTAAAAAAGAALGVALLAGGALLLYTERGFLSSAGFLIALALLSTAAGVWVGAPDGPAPSHRRILGRWMLAVGAMVVASFVATAWLRIPSLQASTFGPPIALVLLIAEPGYAVGALLAALQVRGPKPLAGATRAGAAAAGAAARAATARGGAEAGARGIAGAGRTRGGAPDPSTGSGLRGSPRGVAVPALLGAAAGAAAAAWWLIPALPPGPVFLGVALLLSAAGTAEMMRGGETTEAAMAGVVLVTGVGGRGQLGYALAKAFHERGSRVVLAGLSEEVERHAAELGEGAVGVRADLATEEGAAAAVDAARSRWGRLDAVINAAGGLTVVKPLAETSAEEWARELDRNAKTAFLVSRAALPLLRESRGAVVNFASPAVARPVDGLGAYSASKAGVVALTRALALEEKASGVRANAIAPGMVDTDENRAAVQRPDSVDWVAREDVAAVVLFLAGPGAAAVTGQVIGVGGP